MRTKLLNAISPALCLMLKKVLLMWIFLVSLNMSILLFYSSICLWIAPYQALNWLGNHSDGTRGYSLSCCDWRVLRRSRETRASFLLIRHLLMLCAKLQAVRKKLRIFFLNYHKASYSQKKECNFCIILGINIWTSISKNFLDPISMNYHY